MTDLNDPAAAAAAVADPRTSALELSQIAQHHRQLRTQVAMHPAAYPGLLDWLDGLGDPMLSAVVAVRRDADRSAAGPVPGGQPQSPVLFDQSLQPADWREGPQPVTTGVLPAAQPPRGRKRLVIALSAVVVVVALVAGFATRGFGLLRFGGAATPQDEAIKVADKTVGLLNSFSLKNLISNPYSAIGDLSDEIAPSEASLEPRFTTVDNSDLLALSGDTITLAADLLGTFKVATDGVKTEVTQITDDIARVDFVEGEITVTADTARLKELLPKVPAVAAAQVETTLAKYGLAPKKSIDLPFPSGWSDDLLSAAEDQFPYRVDLADCAAWRSTGEPLPSSELTGICGLAGRLVVVKEAGKWYLSPMLSWTGIGGVNGYLIRYWTAMGGMPDQLDDPQRQKMLAVTASTSSEPTDAPGALIEALSSGDERTILSRLPLAERRYAAATGSLAYANLSGYTSDYHFTEITRSGNQAKLRVDELKLSNGGSDFVIEDGTCITYFGSAGCLSDLKDAQAIESGFAYLREQDWTEFEETTGVSGGMVIDKLETATKAAVKAIDPEQVGLVAVQEDGGWLLSIAATTSELQNQLGAALRAGFLSIQE